MPCGPTRLEALVGPLSSISRICREACPVCKFVIGESERRLLASRGSHLSQAFQKLLRLLRLNNPRPSYQQPGQGNEFFKRRFEDRQRQPGCDSLQLGHTPAQHGSRCSFRRFRLFGTDCRFFFACGFFHFIRGRRRRLDLHCSLDLGLDVNFNLDFNLGFLFDDGLGLRLGLFFNLCFNLGLILGLGLNLLERDFPLTRNDPFGRGRFADDRARGDFDLFVNVWNNRRFGQARGGVEDIEAVLERTLCRYELFHPPGSVCLGGTQLVDDFLNTRGEFLPTKRDRGLLHCERLHERTTGRLAGSRRFRNLFVPSALQRSGKACQTFFGFSHTRNKSTHGRYHPSNPVSVATR